MKIKFNWGTGIFLFLMLFLIACGVFIYFASQQDVNLVHKNYYEKGVDYSEQMKVESRSAQFRNLISVDEAAETFSIQFDSTLAARIDSGEVLFYYPAESSKDLLIPLVAEHTTRVLKSGLLHGRYEVIITWFMEGEEYEVTKTIVNKQN